MEIQHKLDSLLLRRETEGLETKHIQCSAITWNKLIEEINLNLNKKVPIDYNQDLKWRGIEIKIRESLPLNTFKFI